MKISVVIPTYSRRQLLSRVLPTVFDQDFPCHEREIVIVVDGSTDGTAEYLRGLKAPCRFTVIEQPNRGPASARNAGVRAASGDTVLFLDDDIRCDSDLLSRHVAAQARHRSSVIFGPVLVAPESPQNPATDWAAKWYRDYADRLIREGRPRSKYDVWVYSNCSIDRALFVQSGGYNETFRWAAYEDGEIAIRLWDAGIEFHFEPAARVYQVYDKTPERLVRVDAVQHARSEVMLCRMQPQVRPHTRLAKVNRSALRKFLSFLSWHSPISPEILLRPPFHFAAKFRSIAAIRSGATRLLQFRMGIESFRSAVDEVGSWREVRSQYAMKLPILLYHDVGDPALGAYPEQNISPEQFEAQVRWLAARGYTGIRVSDWLAWLNCGKRLPEKPVLFSFDDGYSGVSKYALPVLERYGFKAAVFVVTSCIGKTNAWDEADGIASRPLMGAEEIRHWTARGFDFGSHSRTHADLTQLAAGELEAEVAGSRHDLAAILGDAPAAFAYPYGHFNEAVVRCVSANFPSALSTIRGVNTITTDPCLLKRSMVRPRDSIIDLACRVNFGASPIAKARSYLPLSFALRSAGPRATG